MVNASTTPLPFQPTPSSRIHVSRSVWLETDEDLCVVWVHHAPWHRFLASSELERRIVGANLAMTGLARTVEVVEALGLSRATLHRDRHHGGFLSNRHRR